MISKYFDIYGIPAVLYGECEEMVWLYDFLLIEV